MADIVLFKQYDIRSDQRLSEININEVRRYSGMKDDSLDGVIDECVKEAMPVLSYKVSYMRTKIDWESGYPLFPGVGYKSENLRTNLKGCDEVIIFAATVGIGIDRLISKYGHVSESKALFMQALGAERVESLCDLFNSEMNELVSAEGKYLRPRFSPGYGDLPISVQKDFVTVLDCPRRLGINLNDSFLMSPSKSVTAIIGITDRENCDINNYDKESCVHCGKTDCEYRK